jgi:hypothetical protein
MWQKIWDYLKKLWHEIEPVFKHTLVASSIALLVYLSILLLGKILPPNLAHALHKIDEFLIVSCFWLLVGYTLLSLGVRLLGHFIQEGVVAFRKVRDEVKGKNAPAIGEGQDGAASLGHVRLGEAGEPALRPEDVRSEQTG